MPPGVWGLRAPHACLVSSSSALPIGLIVGQPCPAFGLARSPSCVIGHAIAPLLISSSSRARKGASCASLRSFSRLPSSARREIYERLKSALSRPAILSLVTNLLPYILPTSVTRWYSIPIVTLQELTLCVINLTHGLRHPPARPAPTRPAPATVVLGRLCLPSIVGGRLRRLRSSSAISRPSSVISRSPCGRPAPCLSCSMMGGGGRKCTIFADHAHLRQVHSHLARCFVVE